MHRQYRFSHVTERYLDSFQCILSDMIQGMTSAEESCSISQNFIVQMIPHHRAAIEMSENLLQYTTCIPLQDIAESIIAEQTKSIENMQKILCTCQNMTNCTPELLEYRRQTECIMQTMFSEMGIARSTNNINGNFMREMIPHHQGAIRMSRNALQYPICRELVPILQAIITSQERGVMQMQRLLRGLPRGAGNCC